MATRQGSQRLKPGEGARSQPWTVQSVGRFGILPFSFATLARLRASSTDTEHPYRAHAIAVATADSAHSAGAQLAKAIVCAIGVFDAPG